MKVCKKLEKSKNITNYKMMTEREGDKLMYKYLLAEGISDIKGGIMVLKQMNYPKEIIDETNI
jgi:DNA mismatch repair ATPase MutS